MPNYSLSLTTLIRRFALTQSGGQPDARRLSADNHPCRWRTAQPARFYSACIVALAMLSTLTPVAKAGTLYLSRLSSAGENPPTASTATGLGILILNDAETSATITATHNISILVTGGHIHRGTSDINGPVIFPFPAPTSPVGPLTWAIPAADVANLKNLGLYMNFHTTVNPGGAIRGMLVRALLAPAATTGAQSQIANALDVSAGFNADLDQILVQTNLAAAATQTQVLNDLTARTAYVPTRQEIEAMSGLTDSLFAHADDVRLRAAPSTGRVSTFLVGGDAFGKRSTDANQAGSTFSRPFAAAGIEHGWSASGRGGLTVGYADAQDTFRAGLGKTKARIVSVQPFLSGALGDTGVSWDAVVGYGWSKIDSTRQIPSLGLTATSSPSGTVWSAALKASKILALGKQAKVIPYALIDSQEAKVDAYSEAGAGSAGLVIPRLTTKNTAIEGGATLILPITIPSGNLTARLQAGWNALLEGGGKTFSTHLVGSAVAFDTHFAELGKNAAHLEAALTTTMANGLSATLGYRGLFGTDRVVIQAIEARIDFHL